LRIAEEVSQHCATQRLKVATQYANAPMQRGGMHPRDAWEEVNKETLEIAQEGAFALCAPELLKERQRQNLRVREPLETLVAVCVGIEKGVGIVDKTEQDGEGLFQGGERRGMLGLGHPELLWLGSGRMVFFLLSIHATLI
jgi:hypothetical protein